MIIQEFKYQYTWGSTFDVEADVILHYKYDSGRAQLYVTVHDGSELDSGTFTVVSYEDVLKQLTVMMAEFVTDFDAGKYNV